MQTDPAHLIEANDARTHLHGDETRQALIQAAIRVIAENGVAGASLRAINVAAGSRNSSAAHYHFGTKLAIIEAALIALYAEVRGPQEPLLAALEERAAQGRPVSVREMVEAAYLPYLALLGRPEFGPVAAKFMSRILVESDEELQAVVNRMVAPAMLRSLALLKYALPEIPEETLKLRLLITITNVIHGAGDMPAMHNSPLGNVAGDNPLAVLHRLFEYITAAVSAPALPMIPADEIRMGTALLPPTT